MLNDELILHTLLYSGLLTFLMASVAMVYQRGRVSQAARHVMKCKLSSQVFLSTTNSRRTKSRLKVR